MNHLRLSFAAALAAAAVATVPAVAPTAALASSTQESVFQDDDLLLHGEPAQVSETLDTMAALGVDRLRLSLLWRTIAPLPEQDVDVDGFDATDPGAYPQGVWDRHDLVIREAQARGIKVNLTVSGPAPDWATGTPERAELDETFDPDAKAYGQFLQAAGKRYGGSFTGGDGRPLPRVESWSIWNEPNQPGWLTPQWAKDPRSADAQIETSPRIYRALVDEGVAALRSTGHEHDTILIGETAPKGVRVKGESRAIAPGPFIRRLYCLGDDLKTLKGSTAELLGCPVDGDAKKVMSEHPGLFGATGFAHHPYELVRSPSASPGDRDFFTIANLSALSTLLRKVNAAFGRKGGIPLYLTEYGYQTRPPDPNGVSQANQAKFLDESEYRTWRDKGVRSLAQFLLDDDEPREADGFGTTFQTGLRTQDGKPKPAFTSYGTPIWLPSPKLRGRSLRVWGLARAAKGRPKVQVLVRSRGAKRFRVARTVTGTTRGYVDTRITVRRSGSVRLRWRHPDGGLRQSRIAPFSVRP
ncbi:hypothetical protein [Conexibacter sp. SYSU D00693]|uniref:hypothetical protein n=1 Tax=Conexibacter sp. SYSU D00693 TaxID=2812560 RepID=UPI00196A2A46|nr:hypothetical protein [Conexibacter sp. SYSU D00693]